VARFVARRPRGLLQLKGSGPQCGWEMFEPTALVDFLYKAFFALIIIRSILSWVPDLGHRFPALVHAVSQITSPILDPIRRVMPPIGGLDLSPIVAILLLALARDLLKAALLMLP